MMLTPQKIAAIKAVADDARGEPNTRAAAKAKQEQYRRERPDLFQEGMTPKMFNDIMNQARAAYGGNQHQNPPNPRMQKSDEFAKWRFMGMDNWKRSDNGNYTITVSSGFLAEFRVTLFKKENRWKWVFSRNNGDTTFSSHSFSVIDEAMRDAWASLGI